MDEKKLEPYPTLRVEFEERVSPPHYRERSRKGSIGPCQKFFAFFNIKSRILSHKLYTFCIFHI